ncbi:hypothetical protein D3C76_1628890 [compost metagenome]
MAILHQGVGNFGTHARAATDQPNKQFLQGFLAFSMRSLRMTCNCSCSAAGLRLWLFATAAWAAASSSSRVTWVATQRRNSCWVCGSLSTLGGAPSSIAHQLATCCASVKRK